MNNIILTINPINAIIKFSIVYPQSILPVNGSWNNGNLERLRDFNVQLFRY